MRIWMGYHISILLLVTTSHTPSVTTSNYRDTNPGFMPTYYDTTRAYTPTRLLLLYLLLLTITCYQPLDNNLLLVYRQPQTLQQSFALCRLHSGELHKQSFMSAIASWGSPHVGHTGSTRGCHYPKLTPPSNHLPPWANYTQMGNIINTRLARTLGSTAHLRRLRATIIMRAQERLNMVDNNTNCNIQITTTAART